MAPIAVPSAWCHLMPPRNAAAFALVAAMALTGANVAFGKAIAAAIPVYVFVFFRFAVASVALLPLAYREPGPRLACMSPGQWRDLALENKGVRYR